MELMDSEMPVTVEGTSTSAIPRRRTHHEVIDVDEFDDEHDQRPSRRPRRPVSRGNSSRDPVSSDVIILDSDDGEAGPSVRRRPSRKATLTFLSLPLHLIRSFEMLAYARLLLQSNSFTCHLQSHLYRVLVRTATHMFFLRMSFVRTLSHLRLKRPWHLPT